MQNATSTSLLPAKGWLASLTDDERALFGACGEIIPVEPKNAIIHERQPQPYFFFVIQGMLSVRRGDAVVAVVCAGEFLGEMTVASGSTASATVVALEPCQLWRMSHEALMQFINEHPKIGIRILLALLSTVSERLQAANTDLAELLTDRRK